MPTQAEKTSKWLQEEIQRARPGNLTRDLIITIILSIAMPVVTILAWRVMKPQGILGISGFVTFGLIGNVLAWLFAYFITDGGKAFGSWKEKAWIGNDSVWMLDDRGKLCVRIEKRNRREPQENTGRWVVCVPLGGWGAKPSLRYAKSGNDHQSISISGVKWKDSIVESIVMSDHQGNRLEASVADLLEMMENRWYPDKDDNSVGRLVHDATSLAASRAAEHQDCRKRVENIDNRLSAEERSNEHLREKINHRDNELACAQQSLAYVRPRISKAIAQANSLHIIAIMAEDSLEAIRQHIEKESSRLRQKAPRDFEKLRDLIRDHRRDLAKEIGSFNDHLGTLITEKEVQEINQALSWARKG